jgi:hypothetical protein
VDRQTFVATKVTKVVNSVPTTASEVLVVKQTKQRPEKIELEPGAEKRLANIFKKALNTPPKHVPAKRKQRGDNAQK